MKKIMISALVLAGTMALYSFTGKVKSITVKITAANYGLLYHNKLTVFYEVEGFTPENSNRRSNDTTFCITYTDSTCKKEINRFVWIFKKPIQNGIFATVDEYNSFPPEFAYTAVWARIIVHIRYGNQLFIAESPPERILPNR